MLALLFRVYLHGWYSVRGYPSVTPCIPFAKLQRFEFSIPIRRLKRVQQALQLGCEIPSIGDTTHDRRCDI